MSDSRQTIEATIPGEVWWIIAITEHLLQDRRDTLGPYFTSTGGEGWEAIHSPPETGDNLLKTPAEIWNTPSEFFAPSLWTVKIRGDAESATMRIVAPDDQVEEWEEIIDRLRSIVHQAGRHRKWAIGTTFERILDRYYEIKARGGSPNLREMARQAGVKIGSLRQAKIRYDQRRRAQDVSQDTNT